MCQKESRNVQLCSSESGERPPSKSEWNKCSRSFSDWLHRVNTFVFNFNFVWAVIHLRKFSKVQNFPSYLHNVQCDDIVATSLVVLH